MKAHALLLTAVALWGLVTLPAAAAGQAEAADVPVPAPAAAPAPEAAVPAVPMSAVSPKLAGQRVGIVDMERISKESAMGKASQTAVKEQQQKVQKEIDARKAKLEKMQAELEKKLPTLRQAQRDARIKEFQGKVNEMQKFGMNAEKELMALRVKLTDELFKSIEDAGKIIGKASGLTVLVVKGNILYLDADAQQQEITDEVIKLLDAGGEKK